ncbi:substrate-binding domain-containing protein [Nocardia sp. CC201C]|uniref:substrate-binding domain-containing protein n=1 Tax=Nocardia sp. CC201C TaxID=3044575 RepID=UPI0024A8CCC5|nr:substrate-binding domain-containing protein [Nocardia sp. CC201C]
MEGFPLAEVSAILGILVPALAFLWEFVVVGRKRLGYRVQMDTPVTGEVESAFPGLLTQLRPRPDGSLTDLSIVLLRVENDGATTIDQHDYRVHDGVAAGLSVIFERRRVVGYAVTELSDRDLGRSLTGTAGIAVREDTERDFGVLDLPRVPLNRGDHYKLLTILRRTGGTDDYPAPRLEGRLKNGRVHENRSRTRPSPWGVALILFLVSVIAVQLTIAVTQPRAAPLDCAPGRLTLTGSTALAPAIQAAATAYEKVCPDADFTADFRGSEVGLQTLNAAGSAAADNASPAMVAVSDGEKGDGYPRLLPRPVAFSLFTLVVHPDTGVADLSRANIRALYEGSITNWSELGGRDLPVRIVGRNRGSGTRQTFENQLLDGAWHPDANSTDCRTIGNPAASGPVRCERLSTAEVLTTVAALPGALGYAELGAAVPRRDVTLVRIDGHAAELLNATHGAYPFWNTEFAYTYGDPAAESLTASFLRYLTTQLGRDILRAHGNIPCDELDNPVRCRPTG